MGAIGFPTCVSSPEISHSYCLRFGLSPSFPRLIWVRGLSPVQRGSRSKVRHPQLAITGIGSRRILISFSPLVTRLEVRALRLGLGEPSQMAGIQGPARAVINMSLLAYLFIPEDFITEGLLHLPLFPRTGRSERRTSPSASILPDSGLRDSQSKMPRPKLPPGRGPQLPYYDNLPPKDGASLPLKYPYWVLASKPNARWGWTTWAYTGFVPCFGTYVPSQSQSFRRRVFPHDP